MTRDELFEYKERANKFNRSNSAFVHVEMLNGKAPEQMICGDSFAMLYCIEGVLARIGEIAGTDFDEVVEALLFQHKVGRANVQELFRDGTYKQYPGSMNMMEEELKKENDKKLVKLQKKIETLELENAKLRENLAYKENEIKVRLEKQSKEHFKELQKKEKEILKLDHENERLTALIRGEA